jgi:5-methylcytosine-specific restriction enzyme subunit McrC
MAANIKISNIYYMLAYAFRGLTASNAVNLGNEDFENLHTLFAEIILHGMNRQIKRGIQRGYTAHTEPLSGLRGKIDISASVCQLTPLKRQLVCEFDEFTEDTLPNRIIKAAMMVLLRHGELDAKKRRELKRITDYLGAVTNIRPCDVRFDILKSQRVDKEYKMLLSVCKLLFDGLLMNEADGSYKLRSWLPDEKMHKLYESFVREYYRYHHPELNASASQIKWDLADTDNTEFLPMMQSDTTLTNGNKTLIIDTKWYSRTLLSSHHSDKVKYHSANLYQIYSYVHNHAKNTKGNVYGTLLYAKTDEAVTPNSNYTISGNGISVKTLDLSQNFSSIKSQLENLAAIIAL